MAKQTDMDKEQELRNPLTGKQPNSFTQVTNRTLPDPTNVKPFEGDARERGRLQRRHQSATKPGGVVDAQVGYQKPEGMTDRHFAWVTGAQRMFPNVSAERNEPAINAPHEANPGVTAQRRAEDLSGKEYRKGSAVLAHFGHDSKDPVGSLKDVQTRTLHRVIAEHAQAGVEESASQMFYGGRVNTTIPDEDKDAEHFTGVSAANSRFRSSVGAVATHPEFVSKTPTLTHRERMSAATNMMAQATGDTSPNSKWRDSNGRWPNMEQAEETIRAGFSGDEPKFISGRIQNNDKSVGRVIESMKTGDFGVHKYGNPKTAPKTVAFRGALVDRDAPDAYKVSDVHEASVIAPGLPTAKSKAYSGGGKTTRTYIYPDDPKAKTRGLAPVWDMKHNKDLVGLSRPEQMLAKGGGTVHALNDYATRSVLADHGLSRSVNHADNVHAIQAAAWGSQQMVRKDVNVSHADQYPVVRDWGHEGVNVPNSPDVLGSLRRGDTHNNLGQQFRTNPNTTGISKSPKTDRLVNPTKSKPYPVMPGE